MTTVWIASQWFAKTTKMDGDDVDCFVATRKDIDGVRFSSSREMEQQRNDVAIQSGVVDMDCHAVACNDSGGETWIALW